MHQMVALAGGLRAGWLGRAALFDAWRQAEHGRFGLWLPVFMGAGVLCYFARTTEPPFWAGVAVALPALAGAWLAADRPIARALLASVAAAACGFGACQLATWRAPPVAPLPRTATVLTGVVRGVEVLPEGRRVTLARPSLDGAPPIARALRVRLRGDDPAPLETGDTIRLRTLLRPSPPPAYPGAWDLQRDAFFAGLDGGGWALGNATVLARAAPDGFMARLQALREAIDRRIAAELPGATGAIAATLLTGITSAIPADDRAAFRDSGLAHLLAVAGLHIGIVMGLVLGLARTLLALSERAALFWPCKQIAALAALAAGGGYMLLTGMHVPIVRSFAMACLFTLAVLAGRRALSLRGLALAATVLMLTEPEQVTGVSFQMSFSAVLALIAGYDALRPMLLRLRGHGGWLHRMRHHLVALALTSFLAGTASAPFGAYHFGHVQTYYVWSNLVAVPITAALVMPAGLIALALMPLGLERLALVPMGWGVQAILFVAHTTTDLPRSTIAVPHAPAWGLGVLSLGMAWLGLWRSRLRLAGVPAILAGLMSPLLDHPPDILVSADARLIALRVPGGMVVQTRPGAAAFTLDAWRQYWAATDTPMPEAQGEAAGGAVTCTAQSCTLRPRTESPAALLLRGDGPVSCAEAAIVLSAEPARTRCDTSAPLIDRFTVWRNGAYAVWLRPEGAEVLSDREFRGSRPWVPAMPLPRAIAGLKMAEPEALPPP